MKAALAAFALAATAAHADELYLVAAASASGSDVTLTVQDAAGDDPLNDVTFPRAEPAWNLETGTKATVAQVKPADILYVQRSGAERRLMFLTAGKEVSKKLAEQEPETAAMINQLSAAMRVQAAALPGQAKKPPPSAAELEKQARAFVYVYALAMETSFLQSQEDELVAAMKDSPPDDGPEYVAVATRLPSLGKRDADLLHDQLFTALREWAESADPVAVKMKAFGQPRPDRAAKAMQEMVSAGRRQRFGPQQISKALTAKQIWMKGLVEKKGVLELEGLAISNEDLADLMVDMENLVWTPKGPGRVVERKTGAKNVRIEIFEQDHDVEEFVLSEVAPVFARVDLLRATIKEEVVDSKPFRRVEFKIAASLGECEWSDSVAKEIAASPGVSMTARLLRAFGSAADRKRAEAALEGFGACGDASAKAVGAASKSFAAFPFARRFR